MITKGEFINRFGINAFNVLPKEAIVAQEKEVWVKEEYFPD